MIVSETADDFAPVFIVGVQRSGTTLLRTMLHAHPDLCIGYECAFYKKLADKYRGGVVTADADAFLDDLFAVRRFDLWELDRNAVRTVLFQKQEAALSYSEAIRRIALCYLQKKKPKSEVFGFKNPHGIYHLNFIFDLFPKAKILHMIRDPRAVLNSEKKKQSKVGRYQPLDMAWAVAQRHRKMIKVFESNKQDPRYFPIFYHDLITNFEPTLEKVLEFLGLKIEDDVRNYHIVAQKNSFTPQKELWQHNKSLERPDPGRVNVFKKDLTSKELSTIEMLCGKTLGALPNVERFGSNLDGIFGVSQILMYKVGQKLRGQNRTRSYPSQRGSQ